MILLLDDVRFTIIKKLGLWCSDAVICYIRENILNFSNGVSRSFAHQQNIESFLNAKEFIESIRLQHGSDLD